jgi:hypothetical protein
MIDPVETAIAPDDVRDILAAAADVMFSDGIPAELLEQWTAETCFLLQARVLSEASVTRRHDWPGSSNR